MSSAGTGRARLESIGLLRGLLSELMALDRGRDLGFVARTLVVRAAPGAALLLTRAPRPRVSHSAPVPAHERRRRPYALP